MSQKRTIGIVGTGHVGAAAAHAVCLRGAASEIILIDQDGARAEGEAMDLMHGQTFYETITVRAGAHKDLSAAQMVIVTAGVGQQCGGLQGYRRRTGSTSPPRSVLEVASKPVDILTDVTQQISRRDPSRIIGTGTMLDTIPFGIRPEPCKGLSRASASDHEIHSTR